MSNDDFDIEEYIDLSVLSGSESAAPFVMESMDEDCSGLSQDCEKDSEDFVSRTVGYLAEHWGLSEKAPEDAVMFLFCELAANIDARLAFVQARERVMCCKGIRLANEKIQRCIESEDCLMAELASAGLNHRKVDDTVRELLDFLNH